MEAMYQRCCGLDIHKATVCACVRIVNADGTIQEEVRTFGTMTRDLLALGDWLRASGVTHVAMEATGVYWKPLWNLFEDQFELLLVNARHVKNVPGRKTDVLDSQWLAHLLSCGLLRASLVPDRARRELRELTRHRTQLINEHTRASNRIEKTLEDANIKLGAVVSDLMGVSGRAMLGGLVQGDSGPDELAELARARLRGKIPQLRQALEGRVTEHHRFMLESLLDHATYLEDQIDRFTERIETLLRPFEQAVSILVTAPGVAERAAQSILAEIGTDMSRFPTEHHLASWVGLCPGNNESAGKRKSGRTTKGNQWLRATLVQCAWAASRKKGSYFYAQYRRLAPRRGKKRALIAVAHSLLTSIYHMLKHNVEYQDLGADYFEKLNGDKLLRYHVHRIAELGYDVTLQERVA